MTPLTRTSPGKTSERIAPCVRNAVFPLTVYIIGFFVFFRGQIFSDFDLAFGDRGDGRLMIFIHEHVYHWLRGEADLLSPPFFFNQTGTLGYSDALVLDQLIYAPLRLLGAEPFLALSLTAIILSPIAYLFAYLFLRRLDVSVPLASIAALILIFANNLFLKSQHPVTFAVYYIPILAYCGLVAISDLHRRPFRAYLLASFAAALYGLLFSTGYYMAWFFGLALLIFTPIAGYLAWPLFGIWWSERPTRVFYLGLAAGLSFLAALTIFAVIYVPVLAAGATRDFGEYLHYAATPIDLVNVGIDNFVWSGLIRSLHLIRDDRLSNIEVSIALTPVVQILLVSSAALAFRPGFWPTSDFGRISRAFVIGGASVCVLFYLVTIQTHNHSLFRLLYAIVPGARAIRVGYRAMIVANLFAVTSIALTFDQLIGLTLREPRPVVRTFRLGALASVLALAVIEQVNLAEVTHLSRKFERMHLAAVGKSLPECRSFYAAPQAGRAPYEVQVDAMMIALAQHLPTINGNSALLPPDWNLEPDAADYEQRAERWALNRNISKGLCRADIDKGSWTLVDMDRDWNCASGTCVRRISFDQSNEFAINLMLHGNGASFTDDHWQKPEPGGQWTKTTQATLSLSVGRPRDLTVVLSIRALLSARAPQQSAWIEANQCRVGGSEFDLAHDAQTISGVIPTNCIDAHGTIVLRVNTDRVRTPKEIGINTDTRLLGVMVDHVIVRETSPAER